MSTPTALSLEALGPGLTDPVHGAQRSFRAVLDAMSRPGRVQTLPPDNLAGAPAPGLGEAATAVLLTLLDVQVRLWLSAPLRRAGSADFLRFHSGVTLVDNAADADVAVLHAADADPTLWTTLNPGTDAAPQDGATLLLDAAGLQRDASPRALRGPGIETVQHLGVAALDDAFWAARDTLGPAYPCGIDLLLCDRSALAAVPRTTRLSPKE